MAFFEMDDYSSAKKEKDGDKEFDEDEIVFDDMFGIAIVDDPEAAKRDQKFCSYFIVFGVIIPVLLGLMSATIIGLVKVNGAQTTLENLETYVNILEQEVGLLQAGYKSQAAEYTSDFVNCTKKNGILSMRKGACFYVIDNTKKINFDETRQKCEAEGAELAYFEDDAELQVLADVLTFSTNSVATSALMGFEGDGEGQYTSLDGQKTLNLTRPTLIPKDDPRSDITGWSPNRPQDQYQGPQYFFISLRVSSTSAATFNEEEEGIKMRFQICAKSLL